MTPDDWLARLRARLEVDESAPSEAEVAALLDVARIGARASERWAAPISTYLIGMAMAGVDPPEREDRLRALVADLAEQAQDG